MEDEFLEEVFFREVLFEKAPFKIRIIGKSDIFFVRIGKLSDFNYLLGIDLKDTFYNSCIVDGFYIVIKGQNISHIFLKNYVERL
jgi:hypothetical protein